MVLFWVLLLLFFTELTSISLILWQTDRACVFPSFVYGHIYWSFLLGEECLEWVRRPHVTRFPDHRLIPLSLRPYELAHFEIPIFSSSRSPFHFESKYFWSISMDLYILESLFSFLWCISHLVLAQPSRFLRSCNLESTSPSICEPTSYLGRLSLELPF